MRGVRLPYTHLMHLKPTNISPTHSIHTPYSLTQQEVAVCGTHGQVQGPFWIRHFLSEIMNDMGTRIRYGIGMDISYDMRMGLGISLNIYVG